MSSIVTYKNTEDQCFCQIKFDSGERVMISIAAMPVPSIKVFRMKLGGLLTGETVWEYSAAMAGGNAEYVQALRTMFAGGALNEPLDDIKDVLLECRSIDECRGVLASRMARVTMSGAGRRPKHERKLAELLERYEAEVRAADKE